MPTIDYKNVTLEQLKEACEILSFSEEALDNFVNTFWSVFSQKGGE